MEQPVFRELKLLPGVFSGILQEWGWTPSLLGGDLSLDVPERAGKGEGYGEADTGGAEEDQGEGREL